MPVRRRTNFSKAVREAALERADGRCEHIDEVGNRCPCALQDHYYQFAHVIADGIGGRPTLENCRVWCTPCHRGEFARDIAVIAQTRRLEKQRIGVSCTRRPMAGSRFSSEYRGFDGLVRDRDTGAVRSHPWAIDVRAL